MVERTEFIERLRGYEWTDIEFKEARRDVPRSAYETVSAFANTQGGHLVFGVKQSNEDFEIVGVLSVDKVQGDFMSTLLTAGQDQRGSGHKAGASSSGRGRPSGLLRSRSKPRRETRVSE